MGPEVSVSVPLDGVEAKLSMASMTPAEQSKKATKARGLKAPTSQPGFVFIVYLRIVPRQKNGRMEEDVLPAFPVSESPRGLSEEASDSSTGPKQFGVQRTSR